MRELNEFLAAVGATYVLTDVRVNLNDRRFAVPSDVVKYMHDKVRLVYAGMLLGRTKREFVPGAGLLRELGQMKGPNKAWVDERVGWLFACGRDAFAGSIIRSEGDLADGRCFLVMMGDDCIGYGRVEERNNELLLRNLFDLGDFLRRERGLEDNR
jgi:ribosome biogenesis protein Nip4